jgi:hypothetical protein
VPTSLTRGNVGAFPFWGKFEPPHGGIKIPTFLLKNKHLTIEKV